MRLEGKAYGPKCDGVEEGVLHVENVATGHGWRLKMRKMRKMIQKTYLADAYVGDDYGAEHVVANACRRPARLEIDVRAARYDSLGHCAV